MSTIDVRHDGAIAIVTRGLPPLNLSTLASTEQLQVTLRDLAADPSVRAVVIAGAGERFFGAGSDIREFAELRDHGDVIRRKMTPETGVLQLLEEMPKATVAALNGTALGGGLELALSCDFIVGERATQVGLPEIDLGLFPGDGGPVRVTRRVGAPRAKKLMFLGEPISIETAEEWGLVDYVVERGGAVAAATELAHRCAGKPAEALAACKRAIAMSAQPTSAEITRDTLPLFEQVFQSPDAVAAERAFFTKGTPAS